MLGELTVGHVFVGGGDVPEVKQVQTGLLGADYVENGRYRFARIYNGENWNPRLRAPLTQPGVNVKEGEYLLAVNGKELRATDNVYRFFEGHGRQADGAQGRRRPRRHGRARGDGGAGGRRESLRNLAWIEGNRRKVDQLTNGQRRLRLPAGHRIRRADRVSTATSSRRSARRRRSSTSASTAAACWRPHHRLPAPQAARAWRPAATARIRCSRCGGIYGPKVMIINEFAGSGGDALPWHVPPRGLGPLVGKRTWGGLVGIGGYPPLIDGGRSPRRTAASGTSPASGTSRTAASRRTSRSSSTRRRCGRGRDPQLEKAVEVVLEELEKNPPAKWTRPKFPDYRKARGW